MCPRSSLLPRRRASVLALDHLRSLLERWVDFDRLNQSDTDSPAPERPLLVLGAVDVMSGVFKAFDSRRGARTHSWWRAEWSLCPNGLVALDSGIPLSAGAGRWLRIRRSLGDPEGNPVVEQTAPASGSPLVTLSSPGASLLT